MKKYLLLVVILCLSAGLQAQQQGWYRQYSGTIGKYPIMLHLHKVGPSFTGYYYYASTGQPLYFNGSDTSSDANGAVKLLAYHSYPDYSQETFILQLEGKKLKGSWQLRDSAQLVVNGEQVADVFAFDQVFVSGEALLKPGNPASPKATYEAAILWPQAKNKAAVALQKHIADRLGGSGNFTTITSLLEKEKEAFLKEYREMNKNVADSEWAEYPFSFNNSEAKNLLVVYQSSKWLTLAEWYYSYMGGAHGNHATAYTVIKAATGTVAKLDDIFLPAGKKMLPALLEKAFRQQYQLKATESLSDGGLFENKLLPNDNFYITGKGIGFSYSPYEIGPYAMGQIELFIPYRTIKAQLQPAFRQQMNIQ